MNAIYKALKEKSRRFRCFVIGHVYRPFCLTVHLLKAITSLSNKKLKLIMLL